MAKGPFAVTADSFRKLPQAVPGKKKKGGKCFPRTSCVTVRGFFCQNSFFSWCLAQEGETPSAAWAGSVPARGTAPGVQGGMALNGSRAPLGAVLGDTPHPRAFHPLASVLR